MDLIIKKMIKTLNITGDTYDDNINSEENKENDYITELMLGLGFSQYFPYIDPNIFLLL